MSPHRQRSWVARLLAGATVFALMIRPTGAGPDEEEGEEEDAAARVSQFVAPLRAHFQNLALVEGRFKELGGSLQPPQREVKAAGTALLAETKGFRGTLERFRTAQVRRGLGAEFALIDGGVETVVRSVQLLARHAHLKAPAPPQAPTLAEALRNLAEEILAEKIAAFLRKHGLEELLEIKSWQDLRQRVTKKMRAQARQIAHEATQRAVGMPFHDLASAKTALRARIERRLERRVAKLVMRISSNQIVIELGTALIVEWVKEKLWPRLREWARPKGRHEERIQRSIGTIEESYKELKALGSEVHPTELDLRHVARVIQRAEGRKTAMRYLVKDLKRAGKPEDLERLALARKILDEQIKKTKRRFLLDRQKEIAKVAEKEKQLDVMIKLIEKILAAIEEEPEEFARRRFFVWHRNQAQKERAVASERKFWQVEPAKKVPVDLTPKVGYFDLEAWRTDLKSHQGSGWTAKDFDPESPCTERYARIYGRTYLLEVACRGHRRYVLHLKPAKFRATTHGHARCFWMGNGEHEVRVTVHTEEGFTLELDYTLVVAAPMDAEKLAKQAAWLERMRAQHEAAWGDPEANPHNRWQYANSFVKSLVDYAQLLAYQGREPPAQVMRHLRKAGKVIDQMADLPAENRRPYAWISGYLRLLRDVADPHAYPLARRVFDHHYARFPSYDKEHRSARLNMLEDLAGLALASSNDAQAARRYLEERIKLLDAHTDRYQRSPRRKEAAMATLPIQIGTRAKAKPAEMTEEEVDEALDDIIGTEEPEDEKKTPPKKKAPGGDE
ncbi:MAG: hypothetical protein ACYTFD_10810 [Planctomycetota bacterium]|jgi:hypothetical protein